MRVAVVVNEQGGTAANQASLGETLRAAFDKAGIDADLLLVPSEQLPDAIEEAAEAAGFDALVAGGGDGTMSLAAAAALRHDRTLGILPLGTLNHRARDAGIPADLDGAVGVIAAGRVRAIDVAEVNGHIFVNNSSVGLYPLMVREREAQQRQLGRGKRLAMLVASIRALRHFGRRRLTIRIAGQEQPIVTPLLFVGNNRYETSLFALGRRTALDRGELCLYALLVHNRRQLLSLAIRGIFGTLDQQRDFISVTGVTEAEIGTGRPVLNLAADGETLQLETPLRYRVRPRALRLLMPEPQEEAEAVPSAGSGG